MRDSLGVPVEPDEISTLVVERLRERYERDVPLMPHAAETVREPRRSAGRSASPRPPTGR